MVEISVDMRGPYGMRSQEDSEQSQEEASSSDDEIQGTAEATISWVARRGNNMRMRAATMGSLLAVGRRSSNTQRCDNTADDDAGSSYGAAGPPGQIVQATNVAGRSGWQRAATMAAADAAAALSALSVRDRALHFEHPAPSPPEPALPAPPSPTATRSVRAASMGSALRANGDSGLSPRFCSTPL